VRRALFLAALLAAPPLSAEEPRDGRPPVLRKVGIEQRLGTSLPLDLAFRDETGRAVRLSDYFRGKPVVLVFAYYNCPMLCTQVLNGLLQSARVISLDAGKDFEIVVVSFDPKETPKDAAAKRAAYVPRYGRPGSEAGWHFLTGEKEAIARATEAAGFGDAWDESTDQFAHGSAIFVAAPDGRLSRYLFGIEYAPRDLRLALIEASAGRIGTPVLDHVLLFCYRYDPATGKYGAVVMNMVRLGGVAAVLILTTFLTIMWRRDHRRDVVRAR
jgi:protein SCO1/2